MRSAWKAPRPSGFAGSTPNPNLRIINESGFYALVLTSRMPEAQAFRKGVIPEVGRPQRGVTAWGYCVGLGRKNRHS